MYNQMKWLQANTLYKGLQLFHKAKFNISRTCALSSFSIFMMLQL